MTQPLYILWDEAHIWGLIVWRAVTAMRLPYQLVKSIDIAQGALSGKPPLLLVPGGTARLKAKTLGKAGLMEIRRYISTGGHYLGFCGGAGLGLSENGALGLCPWRRDGYSIRLQHLISGHIRSRLQYGHPLCPPISSQEAAAYPLPVWWPGRFAPQPGNTVEILARYDCPGDDLWVADLPLASLPGGTLEDWKHLYGVNLGTDLLHGQPCVLYGRYGQGSYILSYSHLETPDSPTANAWLACLMRQAGFSPAMSLVPPWDVAALPDIWPQTPALQALHTARTGLQALMDMGIAHNLLFRRTSWLRGWRPGIPGAALNNLYTGICTALSLPPTPEALAFWDQRRSRVEQYLPLFLRGIEEYFLAERLSVTLASHLPNAVDRHGLNGRREALFGLPMQGGGFYQELLDLINELVFRCARTG